MEAIKIDNLKNTNDHTFFGGVSIKIELIIDKIKDNLDEFIIFSDATIFINSKNNFELNNFLNLYKDNDLTFADNLNPDQPYNIGFILIKCSIKTLNFFKNALIILKAEKSWDQQVINFELMHHASNLTLNVFDKSKIVCGFDFYQPYTDSYLIFKSFVHHSKSITQTFNSRLDLFKNSGLISEEEYKANYKSTEGHEI
jgi:hypothetical protein